MRSWCCEELVPGRQAMAMHGLCVCWAEQQSAPIGQVS